MNTTLRKRATRRNGYTYLVVMGVALIVSTLGLSTLLMARIQSNETVLASSASQATALSHSAVEHALTAMNTDPNWRTTYVSGIAISDQPLGEGTFSWVIEDTDGDLAEPDTNLRLTGIGRVGQTTRVYSLQLKGANVGPVELRSQTSTASQSEDDVIADKWWCQYLKVSLPAEATGWKITSIELFCRKEYQQETLHVRLYEPLPTDMPSSTIIDSVDIGGSAFTFTLGWHTIDFLGDYVLAPDDGVCIALEASHAWKSPIRIAYTSGGVSEPDSAMITGDPTWTTYDTDKALLYRVHGVYMTADGLMEPVTGSWRWDAAPSSVTAS